MTGSVDLAACPNKRACRCGICSICGFPLHHENHAPFPGEKPGTAPLDHRFILLTLAPRVGTPTETPRT